MQIFIKHPTGKTTVINTNEDMTIHDLAKQISQHMEMNNTFVADHCSLMYGGKYISDNNLTIKDSNITNNTTLLVQYSTSKINKMTPKDYEGKNILNELLKSIFLSHTNPNVIISFGSYRTCLI